MEVKRSQILTIQQVWEGSPVNIGNVLHGLQKGMVPAVIMSQEKGCLLLWPDSGSLSLQLSQRHDDVSWWFVMYMAFLQNEVLLIYKVGLSPVNCALRLGLCAIHAFIMFSYALISLCRENSLRKWSSEAHRCPLWYVTCLIAYHLAPQLLAFSGSLFPWAMWRG